MVNTLCPNCLKVNNQTDIYCKYCNYSLRGTINLDPVQSAQTEGKTLGIGIFNPNRLIIVIGIWILFGIGGITLIIMSLIMGSFEFFLFGILTALPALISTINYVKRNQHKTEDDLL